MPAGEDRHLRRGDRRSPVDPRRPGAGEGGAVRHDDRARLPDAVAPACRLVRGDPAAGPHGDQLRPEQAFGSRRPFRSDRGCVRPSRCVQIDEIEGGGQVTMKATVEREGGDKPVCVAEVVFRLLRVDERGRPRHGRARRDRRRDRDAARRGRLDRARGRPRGRRPDDARREPRGGRRRARDARTARCDRPERGLPARGAGTRFPGRAMGPVARPVAHLSVSARQVRVGCARRVG